jgi:predicted RNA-binding protein
LIGDSPAIPYWPYRRPLCKIAKDRELGNETKIKGQYACKIKIVSLKLKFIEMKQKIENKRDYDKERKELFDNAIKKVDPRIQKTIELIEKINNSNVQIKYELSTSCYSTTI